MPCYEVNLISLELNANNQKLAMKVLQDMTQRPVKKGNIIYSQLGNFDLKNGKAIVDYRKQSQFNQFKQLYSMETIKIAAKKIRWQLKREKLNRFVANKW